MIGDNRANETEMERERAGDVFKGRMMIMGRSRESGKRCEGGNYFYQSCKGRGEGDN